MAQLTPRFSSNRAVREYTEQYYLPAASAYRERAGDKGALGVQVVNWRCGLDQKWSALRFGEVTVETRGEQHVFDVQVCLNDLDPKAVRVELCADGVVGGAPLRQEMQCVRQLAGASGGYVLRSFCVSGPPTSGLYGPSDTALRRRCDPTGRRESRMAAMNPSTQVKTLEEATAITCVFLGIGGVLSANRPR